MFDNVLNVMQLPEYPCERLANAQLPLVTAQTRFPPVTRLSERVQDIREELRRDYPVFAEEKAANLIIKDGKAITEEGGQVFKFSSIDLQWAAVLKDDFIALETRAYGGIQDFSERVDTLWRAINRILDPQYQVRIGFRFINEFHHPEGDDYKTWRTLINPELVGFNASLLLGGSVQQTVSEVILERDDGKLIMRRGFLHGTTVLPLPGKPVNNSGFYLLDLDYFNDKPGAFDASPSSQLRQYNSLLHRIFRWAVSNEYYQFMKVAPR